jgi:hypothetical protein
MNVFEDIKTGLSQAIEITQTRQGEKGIKMDIQKHDSKGTTDARLLDCGYMRHQPTSFDPDGVTDLFQKAVRSADGLRQYFISVRKWSESFHPHTGERRPPSYEFETYFEDKKSRKPLRILLYSGWTIEEAEKQIAEIFSLGLWKDYDTE